MKKIDFLKVAQVLLVTIFVFSPLLVGGASISDKFGCDSSSGLNCNAGTDVNTLIKTIINWLLAVAFGLAVLFLIIGGFWYITSAGNEETAEKGKNTAINAIIGIIVIVLSYVIVSVVANLISGKTSGGTP